MGSCGISSSTNNSVIINNTINNLNSSTNANKCKEIKQNKSLKILEEDKIKFPDLEEYPDEYVGEGIKRIKAFRFNKPYDLLNKMIYDFWSSRTENKNNWIIIKQALDSDYIHAKNILFKNNIFPAEGCINLLIDQDDNLYRVPNFCICEPLVKKEIIQKENIKDEKIKISICNMRDPKNIISVKIATNITCLELKKMYCKIKNIDLEKFRVKAFLMGIEMINENFIGQYNLNKDSKIQISIDEIINSFKSSKKSSFDKKFQKIENNSDTKIDGKFEIETKRSLELNDSNNSKDNFNRESKDIKYLTPKKECINDDPNCIKNYFESNSNTEAKFGVNNTISEYKENEKQLLNKNENFDINITNNIHQDNNINNEIVVNDKDIINVSSKIEDKS